MIPSLEALLESGYFSFLDVHFARTLGHIAGTQDPLELLGAATASRYTMHGHTCAPVLSLSKKPISRLTPALKGVSWPDSKEWIEILQKSPMVHCDPADSPLAPLVYESGRLYLARYWLYERNLARAILTRANSTVDVLDRATLEKGLNRLFSDSPKSAGYAQKQAAQIALERNLTIITGGPGTGKTYTVAKILVLLFEQALAQGKPAPRVSLLAPTGKAAQRLEQSLNQAIDSTDHLELKCSQDIKGLLRKISGSTIHRALGFDPRTPTRFLHNESNPLDADVVMVDEASMVDLPLMSKLFDAVDTEARLILLGDKDQLVSVEVGAVLGDICNRAISTKTQRDMFFGTGIENCIINLTHSFRFSDEQGIGLLARAINAGDAPKALEYLDDDKYPEVSLTEPDDVSLSSLWELIGPIIENGYSSLQTKQDPEKRLDSLGRFRILCAHRRGIYGVESMNLLAQKILKVRPGADSDQLGYDGKPIMITSNDYQLGLFNGDVGVICEDENQEGSLRAFFPGKQTPLVPSRLPPHESVYAMTIHKSQGSEYDHVMVLLPEELSPIVTRELLYTAVTRAKKSVVIIAGRNSITHAIQTPVFRTSGLAHAIWT